MEWNGFGRVGPRRWQSVMYNLDSMICISAHLLAWYKNQWGVTHRDVTFIYICVTWEVLNTRAGRPVHQSPTHPPQPLEKWLQAAEDAVCVQSVNAPEPRTCVGMAGYPWDYLRCKCGLQLFFSSCMHTRTAERQTCAVFVISLWQHCTCTDTRTKSVERKWHYY